MGGYKQRAKLCFREISRELIFNQDLLRLTGSSYCTVKNTEYWLEPPLLISHLKPLTAHFRSNQPRAKIRSADISYVAKRLILHRECGDVSENPVMLVRSLQIWIDFHFTSRPSPSVQSQPPCLSTQMTMRHPRWHPRLSHSFQGSLFSKTSCLSFLPNLPPKTQITTVGSFLFFAQVVNSWKNCLFLESTVQCKQLGTNSYWEWSAHLIKWH